MPFIQDQSGAYRCKGKATPEEICATAAEITSARSLGTEVLSDPEATKRLFIARLRHLEHEEFHVAYLNTRHRLIAVEKLFRGTIDGCEVHPREVVRGALKHNAAAIICAHNHPSGSSEPSAADRAVTARLKQALALVDIRLLDHLVIANPKTESLAARGWV